MVMKKPAFNILVSAMVVSQGGAALATDGAFEAVKTDKKPLTEMPPTPNPGFDALVSKFLVTFAADITAHQNSEKGGLYQYVTKQKQITKEQYHFHLALNREIKHARPDGTQLTVELGKDTVEIVGDHLQDSLAFMEKFSSGFSMDINFAKPIFKEPAPRRHRLVRYGLASKKRQTRPAATAHLWDASTIGADTELSDEYDWTVEEIYDESTAIDLESDAKVAQKATEGSNSFIPSPNFKFKLVPVRKGSKGQLSAQLTQAEGLYNFTINRDLTGGTLAKRHVFTVPLFSHVKAQKTFLDAGLAERTSLLDLKHHPLDHYVINVHYWHQKHHYTTDVGYKLDAHRFNFEFRVQDVFQPAGYISKTDSQYKLSYDFNF